MKKSYLIKHRMNPGEIVELGKTVKLFDQSVREIKNGCIYHPLYQTSISICVCYKQIKNVRNAKGVIIAKRKYVGSPLWCTNQAYPPLKDPVIFRKGK